MKLLVDNNLSYKLCSPLQQHFSEVNHVRNLLSPEADDIEIWNYSIENGFHILTKDNDFEERRLFILNLIIKNKEVIQNLRKPFI